MTIFNQALEIATAEGFDAAWELAKTDGTMDSAVEKNQWITSAKKAIARRVEEAKTITPSAYY